MPRLGTTRGQGAPTFCLTFWDNAGPCVGGHGSWHRSKNTTTVEDTGPLMDSFVRRRALVPGAHAGGWGWWQGEGFRSPAHRPESMHDPDRA
jgi:hypothetical protein